MPQIQPRMQPILSQYSCCLKEHRFVTLLEHTLKLRRTAKNLNIIWAKLEETWENFGMPLGMPIERLYFNQTGFDS